MSENMQGILGCSREKYWSEVTIEEKIERTRREVKSLQSQINFVSRKVDQLLEHFHAEGKIIIPLNRYDDNPKEESRSRGIGKDEVYF